MRLEEVVEVKLRGRMNPKPKAYWPAFTKPKPGTPSISLTLVPVADAMADAIAIFERECVDMGKAYARRYGWNRAEVDETVTRMCGAFGDVLDEYATLVEREDWDELVALAAQEQTRRMIRGGR